MPERRQLLGLAGIALVVLGCFAPLAILGLSGEVTFYGGGHGDGIFALGLMAISAVLLYAQRYRFLLLPASATAAIALLTFLRLSALLHEAQDRIVTLRGDLIMHSDVIDPVGLEWGWIPLVAGIACLIAAGLLPARKL